MAKQKTPVQKMVDRFEADLDTKYAPRFGHVTDVFSIDVYEKLLNSELLVQLSLWDASIGAETMRDVLNEGRSEIIDRTNKLREQR